MSMFEGMPKNPAELAALQAERVISQSFDPEEGAEKVLDDLVFAAGVLGFFESEYLVEAHVAFAISRSIKPDDEGNASYFRFDGLTFGGNLHTYSRVHIGRLVGSGAVRALCLTFDQAFMLPGLDKLAEEDLLHVPVLAVASIDQMAA